MFGRLRPVTSPVLTAACLLLMCAPGGAGGQDKSAGAGDAETDVVYSSSKVDVKAVVRLESSYPSGEGCRERQGTVLLRAILRRTGKVTDVEVRQKSGCEEFDRRAVKAIGKVKFTPARKGGVAVSQYHMRQFNYRIW